MGIKYYRIDLNKASYESPNSDIEFTQQQNTRFHDTMATMDKRDIPVGFNPQQIQSQEPIKPYISKPAPETHQPNFTPAPKQLINPRPTTPKPIAKKGRRGPDLSYRQKVKSIEVSNKPFLFNVNGYMKKLNDAMRASKKLNKSFTIEIL
jgi:hypothetical protein